MKKGGQLLGKIRDEAVNAIHPGKSLIELDSFVENLIKQVSGKPSFKMVPGYHHATCINLNSGVVHGIPTERIIKDGDVVSVDIGLFFNGYHTDVATTLIVGKGTGKKRKLLRVGKKALAKAIMSAKVGNKVNDISSAIQETIEKSGYTCSRTLTGHGVGQSLHQDPPIPCIVTGDYSQSPKLKPGQCLAIEVIYTEGNQQMKLLADGWTLVTSDNKLAAVFEETILVTDKEPIVLTIPKGGK